MELKTSGLPPPKESVFFLILSLKYLGLLTLFLFSTFIFNVHTITDVPIPCPRCAPFHPVSPRPLALTTLLFVFPAYAYMFFG